MRIINNKGLNLFPVNKVNIKLKGIIFAINDHHFKQIGFHLISFKTLVNLTWQELDKTPAYVEVIVTEM